MIDPGKLRERVEVQTATESRNALGEPVRSWSTQTTVWASVEGVSAREALGFGQLEVTVTHRVRMRHISWLTQNVRLLWRGKVLTIISLLEYDNRTEHVAICEETA